jgi:hypothetical protein
MTHPNMMALEYMSDQEEKGGAKDNFDVVLLPNTQIKKSCRIIFGIFVHSHVEESYSLAMDLCALGDD